jgi:hypothetical protein
MCRLRPQYKAPPRSWVDAPIFDQPTPEVDIDKPHSPPLLILILLILSTSHFRGGSVDTKPES